MHAEDGRQLYTVSIDKLTQPFKDAPGDLGVSQAPRVVVNELLESYLMNGDLSDVVLMQRPVMWAICRDCGGPLCSEPGHNGRRGTQRWGDCGDHA
jgi:hypothetical protein